MRLGVLETDSVRDDLRHVFGSYADMFERWLHQVESDLLFTRYDVTKNVYPKHVDDCDAYIITGSSASVSDPMPWIEMLSLFISDLFASEKKLLAFCFGHQLVASTLGGAVAKSTCGWRVGVCRDSIYESRPWMMPSIPSFALPVIHQEQVIELPIGAVPLSGNTDCPYGLVEYRNVALTFQGHPEHQTEYTRSLLLTRQDALTASVVSRGLRSLEDVTDQCLIGRWALKFLDY